MLVLSRNIGEEIVITLGDEEVVIRLIDVKKWRAGGRARIGVSASSSVTIHRREVAERISAEKEEAATPPA